MLPNPNSPENQLQIEIGSNLLLETVRSVFPADRWAEHPLVLGISGGPDSVALLRLLLELRGLSDRCPTLILAHCNYRLRGEESELDEQFVRELANTFQLDCRVWRAEKLTKPGGSGWEAYLRDLRYDFFKQVCCEKGARYLTLAHTADDQVETVFLRLLRGSSLSGLRGIPIQRRLTNETTLIRPLLTIRRQAIRNYLETIDQPFRVDSSNQSDRFLRNRIRNQLLPLLANQFGPELNERMLRLAQEASEFEAVMDQLSGNLLIHFETRHPDALQIQTDKLAGNPRAIVRHAMVKAWRKMSWSERDLTSRHWHALADLLMCKTTEPGVLNLPENRIARRNPDGSVVIR